MQITQLIASIAAAGGLGFINYYVITQMDILTLKGNNELLIKPLLLCLSVIDYCIYLLISTSLIFFDKKILNNFISDDYLIALSLILTMILSFIFSIYFANPIFTKINACINKRRIKNKKAIINNVTCWNKLVDGTGDLYCYVYNFDNQLIANGILNNYSNNIDNQFDFTLFPFDQNVTISEIQQLIREDQYIIKEYINLDKKIMIYTIQDKK